MRNQSRDRRPLRSSVWRSCQPLPRRRRRRLTWTCSAMSPVWAASMSANFLKVLLWTTQLTQTQRRMKRARTKDLLQSRDYRASSKLMIQQVAERQEAQPRLPQRHPQGPRAEAGFQHRCPLQKLKWAPKLKALWKLQAREPCPGLAETILPE